MRTLRIQRCCTVLLFVVLSGIISVAMQRGPETEEAPQIQMMEASPVLRAIDADHDRVLTSTELDNAPAALRTLDKDGDGKLNREEAGATGQRGRRGEGAREGGEAREQPAPGPTADELLAALMTLDKNKDGKLRKSEVPERQAGIFERGDTNRDGVLERDELRKMTADQAAAPVAPPREGRGRGGFGRQDLVATALDKDGNAEISGDEIATAATTLKGLDKNNDGKITEDEVRPTEQGRGARQ